MAYFDGIMVELETEMGAVPILYPDDLAGRGCPMHGALLAHCRFSIMQA